MGKGTGLFSGFFVLNNCLLALWKELDNVCLAPKILELKKGAQVMLLKNLNTPHLVNGSQGTIVGFDTISNATGKSGGEGTRFPIVVFKNGFKVLLGREHWEREVEYHQVGSWTCCQELIDSQHVPCPQCGNACGVGSMIEPSRRKSARLEQIPLKVCYAITVSWPFVISPLLSYSSRRFIKVRG
jgi:hypothetical protein